MRCAILLPSTLDETLDSAHIEAKLLITARARPQWRTQQHLCLPEPYIFCLVMMTDNHPKWSAEKNDHLGNVWAKHRSLLRSKVCISKSFFTWLCSSGSIWCTGRGRNQLPNGSGHLLQVMRGMRDVVIFPGGDGFFLEVGQKMKDFWGPTNVVSERIPKHQ